ncbi:ATP-binding protein [Candidatus Uhrbacteria bacterium]|nr:ATP-binding protein [Candidatus Uhrbacteria bacterium]
MNKNLLSTIVLDQRQSFNREQSVIFRDGLPSPDTSDKKILVLSGVRRSGKSTALRQLVQGRSDFYYLNFEDERLIDFLVTDFQILTEVFLEQFGESRLFLFDEIQNVSGWERFVRRLHDNGHKIVVTGSNARLLSSELATSLTGRYRKIEFYPFSFQEFLRAKKFHVKDARTTKEQSTLHSLFQNYQKNGGFPEVVLSGSADDLRQLYQDILLKDLIVRYRIRQVREFRELALFLLSNSGVPVSFNNLRKVLGFKSVTTVKNFSDAMEEAYLFLSTVKFDFSVKKQILNDRKMYAIDTGLITASSFSFSKDTGRLLENVVAIELRRRGYPLYYFLEKHECDFILKRGPKVEGAIQVTEHMDKKNNNREIEGLIAACSKYNLSRGLILTDSQEDHIRESSIDIEIVPIWKWLLF